jgi:hypothetical protein
MTGAALGPGRGSRPRQLDGGFCGGGPLGPLAFETLEVLVEGKRIAWWRRPWAGLALIVVNQILDAGTIGPVVHVLAPAQAPRSQQPPGLQLLVRALWTSERPGHLAGRRVRPMR